MAGKHEDKSKPNIKALRAFRLKGEAIGVGDVIPKTRFAVKGEWQNLCHMDPPKGEETDDAVGAAKKTKKASEAPAIPAATA